MAQAGRRVAPPSPRFSRVVGEPTEQVRQSHGEGQGELDCALDLFLWPSEKWRGHPVGSE